MHVTAGMAATLLIAYIHHTQIIPSFSIMVHSRCAMLHRTAAMPECGKYWYDRTSHPRQVNTEYHQY